MPTAPSFLRDRATAQGHRVTFAELLFDLVFVFTIIQLSHALAAHFTPLGVLQTGLLVLAVWWTWIFTAWFTNWFDPDRGPVRAALFTTMFLGLVVSSSIPEAFGERGALFGVAFAAMQVGRSAFTLWALRGTGAGRVANFQRITVWLGAAALFWIAGALVEPGPRLALWAAAVLIEYLSPAFGFAVPGLGRSTAADWDISGAHMAERCALFVIVCLGETILVTGRLFAEAAPSVGTGAALAASFATTLVLWRLYFGGVHARAAARIEADGAAGRLGRSVFTYAHLPIVFGILLLAVGAEFLLAHPLDAPTPGVAAASHGGAVLFVAGIGAVSALTGGGRPLAPAIGALAIAAAWIALPARTLLGANAIVLGCLVAVLLAAEAAPFGRARRAPSAPRP